METKTLASYTLDIIDVTEFKEYYYQNKDNFSNVAVNSFLKALDIPPKFFKEQPIETQDELLENREIFVKENKKYFNKVIIVLKSKSEILNACRLDTKVAQDMYEKLKTIENITNRFEHRSFIKDGYVSYVISGDLKNKCKNQVLVVDFPILLNKAPIVHKAFYQLPDETFATPVEHIHYMTSDKIDLDSDYNDIESAIKDNLSFLSDGIPVAEPENILRETDLVSLALVETGTIPKNYQEKVTDYIAKNTKGELTTEKLESLILDFDEELRSYKQVTSLRSVSGFAIKRFLESDSFKVIIQELEELKELDSEITEFERELSL